jgi:hypothetical protein
MLGQFGHQSTIDASGERTTIAGPGQGVVGGAKL